MAWNGSGTFDRTQDFTADEAAGSPDNIISSDKMDNEFDNFKTGLENCLARDGQTSASANISMGNNKLTDLAAPTSNNDAARKAYVDGATYLTAGVFGGLVDGFSALTAASGDELVLADVDDSNNAKKLTLANLATFLESALTNIVPTGSVTATAVSSAPSGWLLCYGQAVSRTTYSALFTAIGTTYGTGDGSTTFNLPDMRGRAVFGKDDMGGSAASRLTSGVSGITATTLGASGGNQNFQAHSHGVTDSGHTHTVSSTPANGTPASGSAKVAGEGSGFTSSYNTSSATTGITINTAGSGGSGNVPPAIILNWIIKT